MESFVEKFAEVEPMGSDFQHEYLKREVMPAVIKGIEWIVEERPNDPVEALAMFLLNSTKSV